MLRKSATVVLAAATVLAVGTSPAQALRYVPTVPLDTSQIRIASCMPSRVCLYKDKVNGFAHFTGRQWTWGANTTSQASTSYVGKSANDQASALVNSSRYTICFYADAGYKKPLGYLTARSWTDWVGKASNDRISSFRPVAKSC